ncbi:hypothetical protein [Nocardioides sp.]|uniref:hypothetical protein n=1 Tax=Nocardioides sp. TaxID=35761 RepID=UPI0037834217
MKTVHEVAERYGVTDAFMALALDKIGFSHARPDTPLSAATIHRFEAEWGDKIRAKRPAAQPGFTSETDIAPTAARAARQPKPHVMRVAHSKVTAGRDASGRVVKRLLDYPVRIHAIDAAGTNDGDPWNGEVVPGAVHFYDGGSETGPPAACGWVRVRAVLGDEFVPADEPELENQCSLCAQIVAAGKGFRTPPHERSYRSPFCEDYLRVQIDGAVAVKNCRLRDFHDGPHRAHDGSEWSIGVDDYVPAPDELGRRITKAS